MTKVEVDKLDYEQMMSDLDIDKLAISKFNEYNQKLNERLTALSFSLDKSLLLIFWIDKKGKFEYVNETSCKLLGYSRTELVKKKVFDIATSLKPQFWASKFSQPKDRDSSILESTLVTKQGLKIPVEITYNLLKLPKKKTICVFARDISKRKNTIKELEKQREFFRQVIDINPNFIFAKDSSGKFTLINQAVADAYGTTVDELIGKTDADFNNNQKEVEHFRSDDLKVLKKKKELFIPEEKITDSKGNIRYLQTVKRPILDSNGKAVQVLGVATDISERKKSEEERLKIETTLLHTQKLESLGILAGGIAHDFNNLLMGVLGNVGLLLKEAEDEPRYQKRLCNIQIAAKRASELTNQLLAYSGKGKFFVRPINFNKTILEMTNLLKASISKNTEIKFNLLNIPNVLADTSQIRQVIMNLISNAAESLTLSHGQIKINTGIVKGKKLKAHNASVTGFLTKERKLIKTYNSNCDLKETYAYFEVQDNGKGMDKNTLENIFDPFFTTKATGRGLGLAAVLGIIRGHKGILQVETEVNLGSTFKVMFPITKEKEEINLVPQTKADLKFKLKGTVLVVDDEITTLNIAKEMLEIYGYTVLTAKNGEEGVKIFKSNYKKLTAVILDMTMPKMDGKEALKQMKEINKSTPVILSSGYHISNATKSISSNEFEGFIQKPYGPKELAQTFHELKLVQKVKL